MFNRFNIIAILRLEKIKTPVIFLASIVIFLALNIAVYRISARLDFSSGKAYTLSPATAKIIKSIDGKVTVKLFISSNLPARLLALKTDVVDLAGEYERQSAGKITLKIIDPKASADAADQAAKFAIPELQLSEIERDTYALSTVYFGIGLEYKDKTESIGQATNMSSLEYDMTALIYRMVREEIPAVGLIGPESSPVMFQNNDELSALRSILSQQFELQDLSLSTDSAEIQISQKTKSIVLVGQDYLEFGKEQMDALSDYLKKGGKIIVMAAGVSVGPDLSSYQSTHNLFDFLAKYGMVLNKDLVLSESAEIASFSTGRSAFIVPYPHWLITTNFDKKGQNFSNISRLLFPWSSSIDIKDKNNVVVLATSENQSWVQTSDFQTSPDQITLPENVKLQAYNLIAEASVAGKGKLMLISTANFVKDTFLSRESTNIDFILNVLNDYVTGGALSGIRARSLSVAPIKELPGGQKDIVKYLNILFLPAVFALFGGLRLWRRSKNT